MKPSVLVLSGIVVGAALGAMFTARVSAEPKRGDASPTRWENACEAAANVLEVNRLGQRRGEAGWEMVSFSGGIACFKRAASSGPGAAAGPASPLPDRSWPGY